MAGLLAGVSRTESFAQLFVLLFVFIFIVAASYFTTRWIASMGMGQSRNKNLKVIETHKVSQNKYIQIIKTGNKYIVVGISKEHMEYLTELEEEQLDLSEAEVIPPSFKDILAKMKKDKSSKK